MKNYVGHGNVITFTSGAAVSSGDAVVLGGLFGVATGDIAAGEEGSIAVVGVFELAKAAGEAWSVGDVIYWDATNWNATTSDGAGANRRIGAAYLAAGASDATGAVRLDGVAA